MSTLPLFQQLSDPPTASDAPDITVSFDYAQLPDDVMMLPLRLARLLTACAIGNAPNASTSWR